MDEPLNEPLNVADAKKRLSELMSRVAFNKERFLIHRRGKPMAALVSADDLSHLEEQAQSRQGLLAAVGSCAGFDGFDLMVERIYNRRRQAVDRSVDLDG